MYKRQAETFKDNVFQLTPSGSAVECIANPNAFRVCFSDPNQGAASAQYIKENNIASKVAVIYDSSDIYSTGIYETFASKSAEDVYKRQVLQAVTPPLSACVYAAQTDTDSRKIKFVFFT